MTALTDVDLPIDDEFPSKILESCRSLLPVTSSRDVAPGEVMIVEVRSSYSEFPERTCFGQTTLGYFEVDEVSLRPWRRSPSVLQSSTSEALYAWTMHCNTTCIDPRETTFNSIGTGQAGCSVTRAADRRHT